MSPNNPYSSTVKNLVYIGIKINPIIFVDTSPNEYINESKNISFDFIISSN